MNIKIIDNISFNNQLKSAKTRKIKLNNNWNQKDKTCFNIKMKLNQKSNSRNKVFSQPCCSCNEIDRKK